MNSILHLPPEFLSALQTEDVQLYLIARGWNRDTQASTARGSLYRNILFPDAEVLLPAYRELADYQERMADIVHMLAAVEERDTQQILMDLSSPQADVLRFQVSSPESLSGNLPLNAGLRIIEGARSLLLAAACSVRHATSFHPRQAYKEALNFLRSCQLGQTERGSFVAKIMAPVAPQVVKQNAIFESDEALFMETEPFARQSTIRLMTALGHIRSAIDSGNYEQIVEGISQGVSANLCEALASMQPDGDQSQLKVQMTWSPSRTKLPRMIRSTLGFSQTAFEIIREAGRQLREVTSVTSQKLEGYVISLRADLTPGGTLEGIVLLKASLDGRPIRVQVQLKGEDYRRACDAHRDGQTVLVSGQLRRDAKLYRIMQPHDFSIASLH